MPKGKANNPKGLGGYAKGHIGLPHHVKRVTAEVFRDNICPEFVKEWYLLVAMGRDPRVILATRDPRTNEEREALPNAPVIEEKPTMETSMRAMEHIMLRRDGQPAQHIQLEQTLQARVSGGLQVDLTALAALTPAALRAIREALEGAAAPALGTPVEPQDALLLDEGGESVPADDDAEAVS